MQMGCKFNSTFKADCAVRTNSVDVVSENAMARVISLFCRISASKIFNINIFSVPPGASKKQRQPYPG